MKNFVILNAAKDLLLEVEPTRESSSLVAGVYPERTRGTPRDDKAGEMQR
jgi:hypothetical protein